MADSQQSPPQPSPSSDTPHSEAVHLALAALEAEWGMEVPEPTPPPREEVPGTTDTQEEAS